SVSGLIAGSYTVTVSDLNGCQIITPFNIVDGGIVTANIASTIDILCFGGNNGSATVVVTDGVPPYTYLWCNGQTTTTVTTLAAGACSVIITDANGCTTTLSATINQPTVLIAGIDTTTQASCFGNCNGSATATESGGVGPYNYLWGNGQTTQTATGLCAGTTTLDITDANGCIASTSVVITEPAVLALSTSSINPSCKDTCDGSASVVATGGTSPYTYTWNDPNTQTNITATGLCDVASVITVADSKGCIAAATEVLIDPPELIASIGTVTDVDCFGNCNGIAQVTVIGGGLPYTYLWSSGDTSSQAVGLCQGNYDVTVNNINGCRSITSTPITEPPVLAVTIAGTNVSCFGACNGLAAATATGGAGSYTYFWDDGLLQSTATAVNLCSAPGGFTYTVVVMDINGCSATESVILTQPTMLGITQNIVQPTTCSSNNGSACVNGIGGVTPYTYLWNDLNATTDSCLSNVFAGGFNVSVTDAMNCTFNMPVLITDIAGPTVDTINAAPLLCFGDNNGSATVSFSGGTPSFTYSWYDGTGALIATGSTVIFNLVAGNYSIVLEDGNQCIDADTFAIIQPQPLASVISPFSDVTCAGTCDGTATVTAVGGTPIYTYSWTTGGTNATDTGMCAGTHSVLVEDANGCQTQSLQVIVDPTPLTFTYVANDVSCNGDADGDISITPSGGTGVYTYYWLQGGQTTSSLIGLAQGTYDVDVSDAMGCVVSNSIVISEPSILAAVANTTPAKCWGADGSATVSPTGGTQPWSYVWNPGGFQTTATATNLLYGNYTVTVTDANSCTVIIAGILVNHVSGPDIDAIPVQGVSCFGFTDGSASVTLDPDSGSFPYTYAWSNGQTGTADNTAGLAGGQGSVTVTDLNGCEFIQTFTIAEPTQVIASIATINPICYGSDATLTASAIDGTPGYNFVWDNGPTTSSQVVNPLITTSYSVTATDVNGCSDAETVVVTVHPQITLITSDKTICEGQNVDLTINASGGDPGVTNYTYVWNPSISTTSLVNVAPSIPGATYNVTVSDGCSTDETISVTVTVDPTPTAVIIAGCFPDPFVVQFDGSNSTIDPSGTIASYDWDFGDTGSGPDNLFSGATTDHVFTPGAGNPFFGVTLTVTSLKGCSNSMVSSIAPPPIALFTVDPFEASSLNAIFDLTDSSTFLDPSTSYEWTFGDDIGAGPGNGTINGVDYTSGTYQLLSHEYQDTGIFYITLTVEEPNGCKDSMGLYIRVKADYIMFAPNTFLPNSFVPENKMFKPKIIGMGDDEFEIYIFDRWGDMIYEFVGNYNTWRGWTGKANSGSTLAQTDVYIWLIKTEDLNQDAHEYIGHVTLLH
ncbi:MAG: gliding motility-associated C-terminal domain-containing protein, partial [Flavobacteriales bacterium]|nr:gliding motility-associated C-terminal domain-containing protein [Flavobacteriales bacterium]